MPKTPVSFRFSPSLLAALKEQAKRENRTVNNLVETVLKQYLERGSLRSKEGGADG